MKDFNGEIEYKNKKYKIVFDLNVMKEIQNKYGTLDKWGALTDGTNENSEPNAEAIIFGFTEMLNEGLDIEYEDKNIEYEPFTQKQVGRMITEIGLKNATKKLNNVVTESTKLEEKNV